MKRFQSGLRRRAVKASAPSTQRKVPSWVPRGGGKSKALGFDLMTAHIVTSGT